MTNLVLEPTETALWHSLVSDAENAAKRRLDETLESYLVMTLMRFSQRPELASSIMALEFLDSATQSGTRQHHTLRDVGDKCLLVSGLFPQNARRRLVSIGYFVNLGRSAYQQLHDRIHGFYGRLAEDFVPMMDVLHAMRTLNRHNEPMELLEAFELWQQSGSQHARERIEAGSSGGSLIRNDLLDNSDTRH